MTVNTNHVALHRGDPIATLWQRWIALWNGDLATAQVILDDDAIRHVATRAVAPPAVEARRFPGLTVRVSALRATYPDGTFTSSAEPLVSGDLMAGRWSFQGTRAEPGDGPGSRVSCRGTDILRIDQGRIVECWTDPDLTGAVALAA